jgi:hypothetical protein
MIRLFLALLSVFTLAPLARADFILIKVDLNQFQFGNLGGKDTLPGLQTGEEPNWIYGAFEFKAGKYPKIHVLDKLNNLKILDLDHKWGKQAYLPWLPNVDVKHIVRPSYAEEFKAKKKKEFGDGKNPQALVRLAYWALVHGLPKEFHATMADLKKADPKWPLAPEDPFQAVLLNELRSQGFRSSNSEEGHYALYYKQGADFIETSLKRRLARMEETFNNFFFWFALQEKVQIPPLPIHRLAVLVDTPPDYEKRQKEWGVAHLQTDCFTPRRENLVFLAAKPVHETYQFLDRNLKPARLALSLVPDQLLQGTPIWANPQNQQNVVAVATIQMLTLLEKVMEDEAEQAAINRECVRQLLGATGILARNVTAPEWIQSGFTSFFETPPGSLHPNFGLPSTTNLVAFKQLRKTGKLPKDPEVLVNLATDHYYRQAQKDLLTFQEADKKGSPKKERDRLLAKVKESQDLANSTSWALFYFLAMRRQTSYFLRYCQQLNELPRHMELSPSTLETCFARAFDMADAKDPLKMDPAKVQYFIDGWFLEMENILLENPEVELFHNELKTTPAIPK